MLYRSLHLPIKILAVAFAVLLSFPLVAADAPKVTAVLSNSQVAVGQTVRLQIRVSGASDATPPQEITTDGLEIGYTGEERESHISFGPSGMQTSTDVTYNYTILPLKTGSFRIPAQTVRVAGNTFRTPELQLNVVSSSGGVTGQTRRSAPNNNATSQIGDAKVAFAELIVPKPSAYVGEIVPVEVHLGFFSHARARPIDGPEITGQGFTMQKLQQSEQPRHETIKGTPYDVLTFKTAIAAARPGKFEVGPVQATALVAVPRRQQSGSRSRSPFDLFNLDDPMLDPFFSNAFGAFTQQEKVAIRSEPATLEVKPLPGNAPSDFSGAVGNFALNVDANPKNLQVGDPITVTATVSGRGNFDRVTAPTTRDDRGWHKYPPSSKFKQDDDVGISGNKTFETVLSPNERKEAVPPFEFSFFDPLKEKYVSLKSEPIPIHVEGASLISPAPSAAPGLSAAPSMSPAASARAQATPQPSTTPGDILYQLTERPKTAESFAPLYLRRNFWLAQLAPLLALIAFSTWSIRRARLGNKEARRTAALQQEAAYLARKLRRDQTASHEYYADASRAVRIKTALATKSDPNVVDVEMVTRAFRLDEKRQAALRQLFDSSDEVRYSGAANGFGNISTEARREIIDLIESLHA